MLTKYQSQTFFFQYQNAVYCLYLYFCINSWWIVVMSFIDSLSLIHHLLISYKFTESKISLVIYTLHKCWVSTGVPIIIQLQVLNPGLHVYTNTAISRNTYLAGCCNTWDVDKLSLNKAEVHVTDVNIQNMTS